LKFILPIENKFTMKKPIPMHAMSIKISTKNNDNPHLNELVDLYFSLKCILNSSVVIIKLYNRFQKFSIYRKEFINYNLYKL